MILTILLIALLSVFVITTAYLYFQIQEKSDNKKINEETIALCKEEVKQATQSLQKTQTEKNLFVEKLNTANSERRALLNLFIFHLNEKAASIITTVQTKDEENKSIELVPTNKKGHPDYKYIYRGSKLAKMPLNDVKHRLPLEVIRHSEFSKEASFITLEDVLSQLRDDHSLTLKEALKLPNA